MIVLTGNPQSTQHIYASVCRGRFASVYMTKVGKDLKKDYQLQAKMQWKDKIVTDNIGVRVGLFFKDKRVRDIDNYNKLWQDALSGIVYEDDAQIQEMFIYKKIDKENPRIEVEIIKL